MYEVRECGGKFGVFKNGLLVTERNTLDGVRWTFSYIVWTVTTKMCQPGEVWLTGKPQGAH